MFLFYPVHCIYCISIHCLYNASALVSLNRQLFKQCCRGEVTKGLESGGYESYKKGRRLRVQILYRVNTFLLVGLIFPSWKEKLALQNCKYFAYVKRVVSPQY